MKTHKTDMMIYYKPSDQGAYGLSENIRNKAGVISAGNNPYVKNLINVEYDPLQINGRQILDVVKQQGLSACMVGM